MALQCALQSATEMEIIPIFRGADYRVQVSTRAKKASSGKTSFAIPIIIENGTAQGYPALLRAIQGGTPHEVARRIANASAPGGMGSVVHPDRTGGSLCGQPLLRRNARCLRIAPGPVFLCFPPGSSPHILQSVMTFSFAAREHWLHPVPTFGTSPITFTKAPTRKNLQSGHGA